MPSRSETADADPTDGRDETEAERLDRNWTEMLQELRVLQTGTQILTGFLLTLAFQPRFADLDAAERAVYLGLVVLATLSTVLGLAPVSLHRILFRARAKAETVRIVHVLMQVTLAAVALLLAGTAGLIFDVTLGPVAGFSAFGAALLVTALLWSAVPGVARLRVRATQRWTPDPARGAPSMRRPGGQSPF